MNAHDCSLLYRWDGARLRLCCTTARRCPDHAATPVRGGRVAGGLSRAAVTAGAR